MSPTIRFYSHTYLYDISLSYGENIQEKLLRDHFNIMRDLCYLFEKLRMLLF